LILFVDDDILAVPELLERHLALHDSRRDIVVRGPIINIEQYEIPDAPRAQLKDYSQVFFCTCNASVRREVLREVGGFDESFVEYGWEDNEVGWRLRRRGLRACFDMEAIVYHYKPAIKTGELDKLVQQAMELGRNAVAYLHKHPHWIVRLATGIWPPNVWVKMLRYTHNRCSAWEDEWNALPQGSEVRKKALEKMIYNGHYWLAVRDELGQSGR
jgi:GT2 family glycosyltransferase